MNPAFQTAMMTQPASGSKSIGLLLDFTNVASIDTDITEEILQANVMDFVQGVFIDNFLNPNPITLTFRTILTAGYVIAVPAQTQAWMPVLVPKGKLFFTAATTLGITVPIHLLNFPVAPQVWPSATVANVTANLTPILGAFVDRSGVATGGNDVVMAANANRKRFQIYNPSGNANSMWVNYGAAPSAGDSLEIMPGGSLDSGIGPVSNQAIHITGTVGQAYVAKEM